MRRCFLEILPSILGESSHNDITVPCSRSKPTFAIFKKSKKAPVVHNGEKGKITCKRGRKRFTTAQPFARATKQTNKQTNNQTTQHKVCRHHARTVGSLSGGAWLDDERNYCDVVSVSDAAAIVAKFDELHGRSTE